MKPEIFDPVEASITFNHQYIIRYTYTIPTWACHINNLNQKQKAINRIYLRSQIVLPYVLCTGMDIYILHTLLFYKTQN